MKKVLILILSSSSIWIQSENQEQISIKNQINKFNTDLSENTTLSDQKLTLEMPDCEEPTYVYLRNGDNNDQYQRVLLTPTKNTQTISLIKALNISIFIVPTEDVENFITCKQNNLNFLQTQIEDSNIKDFRPTIRQKKEQLISNALNECKNLQELLVTSQIFKNIKKHIILPTYQEMLNFQKIQITKNQEYQASHPYHGSTIELYIPEQTLKFSIKK